MGYNIGQAVEMMKAGKRMRRGGWRVADPSFLVFIQGRKIEGKNVFEPMKSYIGETDFISIDHIDAIRFIEDHPVTCQVGYNFTQEDVLTEDWYEVLGVSGS